MLSFPIPYCLAVISANGSVFYGSVNKVGNFFICVLNRCLSPMLIKQGSPLKLEVYSKSYSTKHHLFSENVSLASLSRKSNQTFLFLESF